MASNTPSQLDQLIPAEIKNDQFYAAIRHITATENLKTMLEIGASSGDGSTEALVSGLLANPARPTLFSIEISKVRFAALQQRYAPCPAVKCYNVSSVSIAAFPSEAEVTAFYQSVPSALNGYPLEQVLSWLRADTEYIRSSGVTENGVELIKQENGIERFDLVLIDGSEFTGRAELELVYGARFILLDDILTFKNFHNFHRLRQDVNYKLKGADGRVRYGCAIFERVNPPVT